MTTKKDELKNVAASVRDRLKKIADKNSEDYNTLLVRYAIERLLFRLSKSKHKKRFVLKGAMLFALWKETPHRVTRDLDLLGFGGGRPLRICKKCSLKSAPKQCRMMA